MSDAVTEAARNVLAETNARIDGLEKRVKMLESWQGHVHVPEAGGPAFIEFPKQVGPEVAMNAVHEAEIRARLKLPAEEAKT